MRCCWAVAIALAIVIGANPGAAQAQTFTSPGVKPAGGSGILDTAMAVFSVTTGAARDQDCQDLSAGVACLTLVLTNTTVGSAYKNPDLLSGLFFSDGITNSSSASSILTPQHAHVTVGQDDIIISGQTTVTVSCHATATIGTGSCESDPHWGYKFSASGFSSPSIVSTTATNGIAAAGYSSLNPTFGTAIGFPASAGFDTSGGLDYSIVGSGITSLSGANQPTDLSRNSVTFTWTFPETYVSTLKISNVAFAYGTAPDSVTNAPEPASLAVFGMGLAGLMALRRRGASPRAL